jgi:hypothetical protein
MIESLTEEELQQIENGLARLDNAYNTHNADEYWDAVQHLVEYAPRLVAELRMARTELQAARDQASNAERVKAEAVDLARELSFRARGAS